MDIHYIGRELSLQPTTNNPLDKTPGQKNNEAAQQFEQLYIKTILQPYAKSISADNDMAADLVVNLLAEKMAEARVFSMHKEII